MEQSKIRSIIESLLLVQEKPLSIEKIKDIIQEPDTKEIREAMHHLLEEYQARNSGIQIIEIAGGYKYVTQPELTFWVEKLFKNPRPTKLSPSSLETLSIVAYKQPITRAEIDKLRGVDSSSIVYTLMQKKLIRISGKKDCIGQPFLYSTSDEFLKYFGLSDISEISLLHELQIENTQQL